MSSQHASVSQQPLVSQSFPVPSPVAAPAPTVQQVAAARVEAATPLAERAGAAAALAAKHAADAESRRLLSDDVVDALTAAGFPRHFVPRRFGGAEGGFTDLVRAVATIGEGCASSAWCAALAASTGRMAAFLPLDAQAEIWANGADVHIAGALTPSGRARSVDGGWRLTGEWRFTSGVDFSAWALVCSVASEAPKLPGPPGTPSTPGPRFFAVPRRQYQVVDSWFNTGMRATGSKTLVLDDVLVPKHRSFSRADMFAGRSPNSTARCHTVPMLVVSGLPFAAPALGAAAGVLDAWAAWTAAKVDAAGRPVRGNLGAQLALAEAGGHVDAARLLLERVAASADHGDVTGILPVRNARDCSVATGLLVGAVDRLFRASGTSGQAESHPVQRAWRDVNCIAGHVGLQFEINGAAYGSHVLNALAS